MLKMIAKGHIQGFTLIELIITISIIGILVMLGLPSFTTMIQNTQIRSQTESILSGLQKARAEAVKRNALVRFQLMNDLSNTCAPTVSGKAWVVSQFDATNLCDVNADSTTMVTDAGFDSTTNPLIFLKKDASEGGTNAVVTADQSTIIFNGLGQVSPSATVNINVTNPTGGTCATTGSTGGKMRCLRVQILPGGQTRMCDPALSSSSTDPRKC